jgi:hypothetical protein
MRFYAEITSLKAKTGERKNLVITMFLKYYYLNRLQSFGQLRYNQGIGVIDQRFEKLRWQP